MRGGATRLTTERALNFDVGWSPDNATILYSADVSGPRDLFVRPVNGAAPAKALFASPALFKDARGWSPDGKYVLFEELNPKTNRDLWMLPSDGTTPEVYLQTPYNEVYPVFSADGKWVAYASDESGRNEVYVDSFPKPGRKYRVSANGGTLPSWRHDGREIAFINADSSAVMACDVSVTGGGVTAGAPHTLFRLPKSLVAITLTRDHEKALAALGLTENNTSRLTLIFNWTRALEKE